MKTMIEGYTTTVEEPEHRIKEVSIGQGSAFIVCECGWNTPHYPTEAEARDRYQFHWNECYGKA